MPDKRHLEVLRLLKVNGAMLVRQSKHQVYRLSDGTNFVLSTSPSDVNAAKCALSLLKRLLRQSAGYANGMEAA